MTFRENCRPRYHKGAVLEWRGQVLPGMMDDLGSQWPPLRPLLPKARLCFTPARTQHPVKSIRQAMELD
jgi:hypothetical protein